MPCGIFFLFSSASIISVSGVYDVRPRIIFISDGYPTENIDDGGLDCAHNKMHVSWYFLSVFLSDSFFLLPNFVSFLFVPVLCVPLSNCVIFLFVPVFVCPSLCLTLSSFSLSLSLCVPLSV